MLLLLLTEESWWAGINAVWGVLGILLLIGGAVVVLLAKRNDTLSETQTQRASASEALVKVRDIQISDCEKSNSEIKDELEDVTAEYRTVVSIKLDELFKFWQTKEDSEAHWANVEEENRMLKKRLAQGMREP